MARLFTFVDPPAAQLNDWFATAQVGDGCQIATHDDKPIMSLTKLGLSMVWWSLPKVSSQGSGFTLSMPFTEVLQTWTVAQAGLTAR